MECMGNYIHRDTILHKDIVINQAVMQRELLKGRIRVLTLNGMDSGKCMGNYTHRDTALHIDRVTATQFWINNGVLLQISGSTTMLQNLCIHALRWCSSYQNWEFNCFELQAKWYTCADVMNHDTNRQKCFLGKCREWYFLIWEFQTANKEIAGWSFYMMMMIGDNLVVWWYKYVLVSSFLQM